MKSILNSDLRRWEKDDRAEEIQYARAGKTEKLKSKNSLIDMVLGVLLASGFWGFALAFSYELGII